MKTRCLRISLVACLLASIAVVQALGQWTTHNAPPSLIQPAFFLDGTTVLASTEMYGLFLSQD